MKENRMKVNKNEGIKILYIESIFSTICDG